MHCLEFYFSKDLHRHVKKCKQKSNVSGKSTSHVQSYSAMLLPTHSDISPYLTQVFETMNVDDVSICWKVDDTIIKYGNTMCKKHLNNDDHTRHISSKPRELGRTFFKMKGKSLVTCFKDILHPKLFWEVVKSVTELCGWTEKEKTIESPSLGTKLGITLTKISHLIRREAIIENDSIMRKNWENLCALVEMRWNDKIARVSRT